MSKKNRMLIVKVGSDERPAGIEDIKDMKKKLKKLSKKGSLLKKYDIIVTHHAAEFDFLKLR